jgi:deoxyribonuclease V
MIEWPKDLKRARKLQETLQKKVKITPLKKNPEYIAGVDASFLGDKVIGVACLYRYPEMIFLEESSAVARVLFPYIPGFLSFREGPVIMRAIKGLKISPGLILFDGQGIAHPKGLGIASHIGVLLEMPTIGCAKSRLIGEYKELGMKKGNQSSLRYHGKIVGAVLRTRDDVRPLFVSPGNKIDLRGAIDVALGCTRQYRIPEPLRRADFISKKIKKELSAR